ncbi:hypothetical protein FKM82_002574 [Ascaphus truei]
MSPAQEAVFIKLGFEHHKVAAVRFPEELFQQHAGRNAFHSTNPVTARGSGNAPQKTQHSTQHLEQS